MNFIPPKDKLFDRCRVLSICCYIISFQLPVYGLSNSIVLHWGQGITMGLMGGLTILLGFHLSELIQFLIWLANPMYIQLMLVVSHNYSRNKDFIPSLGQKLNAVASVVFASLFFINGKIITSESGVANEINTFHIGYWLWWSAMVLLAAALLLQEKKVKSGTSWQKYIVAFVLLIFTMLIIGGYRFTRPSSSGLNPMTGKTYSGPYETCKRIEVTFTSDYEMEAVVSSTDVVGHGTLVYSKHYYYIQPYVIADSFRNPIDMQYAIFNKESDQLIIYGRDATYYLSPTQIENQGITNWPLLAQHEVDQRQNDYYVLPKDSIIFSYATNAKELRLPEGYHLSYQQILERQLRKLHYDPESCDCFTTYGREEDWLHYEDDSLQIVFERMCIQTQGHRVVGLRDYSVIPEVIYDKRENQQQ